VICDFYQVSVASAFDDDEHFFFAQLDDWVLCRIYKKSGQASSPMVPPLADYDHLLEDHDEHSSGGGGFVDDSIYAPPASSGTTTTTCSSVNTTTHNQQHAASRELPTVPPSVISDLFFDDYSLAQIFDTAAVPLPLDADQHAQPFAMMHPSLNQLLTVGGGDSDSAWRHSSSELAYSSDYPAGAAAAPPVGGVAKRKATSPADDAGGNKRLHVSRFDAPPATTTTGGLLPPATTSSHYSQMAALGGLTTNHNMLPQF
jgi:hypothetical protein